MKKILAMLLAVMMLLSVASVAMAEDYTDSATKTFSKEYTLVGDSTALSPAETFSFGNVTFVSATDTGVGYDEEWAKANLPTIDTVTYTKGEAGSSTKAKDFTITLPRYSYVGIYTYQFTEVDNKTAGVTYRTTPIRLVVTVINDGQVRVAAVHCENADATTKSGTFENTYSAGKLSVKKTVEGSMGDKNKEFDIKVTFNAPTGDTVKSDITYNDGTETNTVIMAGETGWTTKEVTIHVKHDETVTFTNIPAGVTYTVEETDAALTSGGYTATYTKKEGTIVGNTTQEAGVTNNKGGFIDTGVMLDSMPYVLVLAVVGAAVIALIAKKRRAED